MDSFLQSSGISGFTASVAQFFAGFGLGVEHVLTPTFWLIVFYILFVLFLVLLASRVYKAYFKVLASFVHQVDEVLYSLAQVHYSLEHTRQHSDASKKVFGHFFASKKTLIESQQNYVDFYHSLKQDLHSIEGILGNHIVSSAQLQKMDTKKVFVKRMHTLYDTLTVFLSIITLGVYWLGHKRMHY